MLPSTLLVPDVAALRCDADILLALGSTPRVSGAKPQEYRVAVQNEAGKVYRTATLYGIAPYVNFAMSMRRLGFSQLAARGAAFDAVFQPTTAED